MMKAVLGALVAVPLLFAAPAHADGRGMSVNFQPVFGGIKVSFTEAGGARELQKCTYTSVSVGGLGGLVPPNINKPFDLIPGGNTSTMTLPGIRTGTKWQVIISCNYERPQPPQAPSPAFFNDIVTY